MPDITFKDTQTLTVDVTLTDAEGNALAGALDAGSFVASVDHPENFELTPAPDFKTLTVKVTGPVTSPAVLTVSGTSGGSVLNAGTITLEVIPTVPTAITLSGSAA